MQKALSSRKSCAGFGDPLYYLPVKPIEGDFSIIDRRGKPDKWKGKMKEGKHLMKMCGNRRPFC